MVKTIFIDNPNVAGPSYVDVFIEEFPQCGRESLDLTDAMYDDDPSTPDGTYTAEIVSLPV